MISLLFSLLFSFATPLIILVRGVERIFSLLIGIFLISLAALILTPLGFPYSGEPNALAPQRFMIAHTQRTFHDASGAITNTSSGYWFADMDINSPHILDRHVREVELAELVTKDCIDYLYCGLPYLVPVLTMISKTHWLPGPPPKLLNPIQMTILKREPINIGERLTIKVEGPAHMGIMFSPVVGVELTSWDIMKEVPLEGPLWNNRKTYFIYYSYGLSPVPFTFSLDLKIPKTHKGPILDLAVTSHYLFGPGQITKELRAFVNKFPSWTAVTSWTASYESWII